MRLPVLILAMLATTVASAATIVVAADGTGQYKSIQAAINASANGDTILVRNGTYTEGSTYAIYGGVLQFPHSVTLIGQSVDGVVVNSAIPTNSRTTALLFEPVSGGAYSPGTNVSCMTILHDQPGTEGGTYSYSALSEGTDYNQVTGSVVVQNTIFRLQQNAAKSVLYLNDNGLDLQLENITVDFGSSSGVINYTNYADSTSRIHDSIIYNTTGTASYGGLFPVLYSDEYLSSIHGANSITGNPLFVNPGALNWHLQSTSPALNTGDPSSTYNNADGTRDTMGAYGGVCQGRIYFTTPQISPATATVAPNGSKTFTASGGSGSGYKWSMQSSPSGGSISASGVYTAGNTGNVTDVVKVTDSLGNVGLANVTVLAPVVITGSGLSISNGAAAVAPMQTVALTASGGTGMGYTWALMPAPSGGTITSAGVYTAGSTPNRVDVVTVTDSAGHTGTLNLDVGSGVTVSAPMMVAPRQTVTLTAMGGSGQGFTWKLSTAASGGSITTGGAYTAGTTGSTTDLVYVSDSLGNSATASISVGAGVTLLPATSTIAPMGSITLHANGGSGTGYVFSLASNQSGGSISASGVYQAGTTGNVTDTITVVDSLMNSATATVSVGPNLTITTTPSTVPPLGSVTFSASGGSGTGYMWALEANPSGGSITPNGAYTAGRTGNTVDVVAVGDSLGNIATFSVHVGAGITITAAGTTPPRGTQTLTASGGSGTGYVWSLTSAPSGGTITSGGVYTAGRNGSTSDTVTVQDSLGNTATAQLVVGPSLALTPSSASVAPMGSVSFQAMGGSQSGYTYSLSTNLSGGTISSTGVYQAGPTGHVTDIVTVIDSLQNTASASILVGMGLSITPSQTTVAPRGTVNLTAMGGSGTGYAWSLVSAPSGGTITSSGTYTAGATGSVTDVAMVKDSLGNFAKASLSVGAGVGITPGPGVTLTTGPALAVAPRQSATLSVSGGSGTGYTWALTMAPSGGRITSDGIYTAGSNPNTVDTITVTDSLGNSASLAADVGAGVTLSPAAPMVAPLGSVTFQATGGSGTGYVYSLITNHSGGTITRDGVYTAGSMANATDTVTVVDSLQNSATSVVSVGALLSVMPASPTVAPRGSITFMASGGSGQGYTWSLAAAPSGGTITSDGVYMAGSTGSVTDIVVVTDSAGATIADSVMVGPSVSIAPTPGVVPPLASVTFTAAGGSGTGYLWSLTASPSGGTITPDGAYTAGSKPNTVDVLSVVDSLGNNATFAVNIGPGVAISADGPTPPRGTQTLSASGGSNQGFVWTLTNAPSGGSITSDGIYTAGSTGNVTDTASVTDSLGNTATASLVVGPGVSLTPAAPSVQPLGSISFQASGGSQTGYVYSLSTNLSGGSISPQGQYQAGPTGGVTDVVTVTDSLQNTATALVSVGSSLMVMPTPAMTPPRGSLVFMASGGSGTGYQWSLPMAPSGGTITSDGAYTAGPIGSVTDVAAVKDSLGNSATVPIMVGPGVTIVPGPEVQVTSGPALSVAPHQTASLSATGGSGSGYTWSLTAAPSGGTVASNGTYTAGPDGSMVDMITVTDSLGNTATLAADVGPGVSLSPMAPNVAPMGSVTFQASGGTGTGYQYAMSMNLSGGTISPAGVYQAGPKGGVSDVVTVIDSLENSATATIAVGPVITVMQPGGNIPPRGKRTLTAMGGSGQGYSWSLMKAPSGGMVTSGGTYTAGSTGSVTDLAQVTDSLGNVATVSLSVGPGVTLMPATGSVAPGGHLTFTAQGGSGTDYVWSFAHNGSGGQIASGGAYTAGNQAGVTDSILATDSLGNTATAQVQVQVTAATATTKAAKAGCGCANEAGSDALLMLCVLLGGAWRRQRGARGLVRSARP